MTALSISVIIPTARPDKALFSLLDQLNDMDILEIIIIRPKGERSKFEARHKCKWLTAPKGRGPQIQAGLDDAKGDILWIIHSDSVLPLNAVPEVRRITQNPFTSLGCFPLKFNISNMSLFLFAAFSHIPSRYTTFGDQGFFFQRKFKKDLPDLAAYPLLEDVTLYRALRKQGRVIKANCAITADASRFQRLGMWYTQWRNIVILWKFGHGASPRDLYNAYYKDVSPPIRSRASLSGL